ncbi:MAG: Asp23/Gls24 family envelope stress response protein [Lachnospiraceae bacterium]
MMGQNTMVISGIEGLGEVHVTEEVIAIIAGLAATEVEGVDSLGNNITHDIITRLSRKRLATGVKIARGDDSVEVFLRAVIEMGCIIPDVCKQIQEKVKSAIESITGVTVSSVNIEIATLKVDK